LVLRELEAQVVSTWPRLQRRRGQRRHCVVGRGWRQGKYRDRRSFTAVNPHLELASRCAWRIQPDLLPSGSDLKVERHLPHRGLHSSDVREIDVGELPARIEDIDLKHSARL